VKIPPHLRWKQPVPVPSPPALAQNVLGDDTLENLNYPPALVSLVSDATLGLTLLDYLVGKYMLDPFFAVILTPAKGTGTSQIPLPYKNFTYDSRYIYMINGALHVLCIPDIAFDNKQVQELLISHAHTLLAHLGPQKTFTYLCQHVWWKDMLKDVMSFCNSCTTCAMSKSRTQAPYGLLSTLPVPGRA
jgi:Integrase zinc binding domain